MSTLKSKTASGDLALARGVSIAVPPEDGSIDSSPERESGGRDRAARESAAEGLPAERYSEAWWSARSHQDLDEKNLMAEYFVDHDFLVPLGQSSEGARESVASILVNPGTTPNSIVKKALEWIFKHKKKGEPYFLTWYTPGHFVPTTLSEFRELDSPEKKLSSALRLFLFPGDVDEETQSVLGEHAVNFVTNFQRNFRYSLLSAYSFDLTTGDVKFHFPKEIALQRVLATRWADHKFLFLQTSKFKTDGETAYRLRDMLDTSRSVTIYTVHSPLDDEIVAKVKRLAEKMKLTKLDGNSAHAQASVSKLLRLQIVGRDDVPSTSQAYYRQSSPRRGTPL